MLAHGVDPDSGAAFEGCPTWPASTPPPGAGGGLRGPELCGEELDLPAQLQTPVRGRAPGAP